MPQSYAPYNHGCRRNALPTGIQFRYTEAHREYKGRRDQCTQWESYRKGHSYLQ